MKNLKVFTFLLIVMIYLPSCLGLDEVVYKQSVRVRLKNNTNNTINLWVEGESMNAANLVEPQAIRESVITISFNVTNDEFANPARFSVNAGFNGEAIQSTICTIDYDPTYNKQERIYPVQFNSDGAFSGF
ncbi:MAG: hypothetical protein FD166_1712 [Bacteroidetes bacterium]|nr:MAG: hypothetical protein FD166_1712 [Bacteroidota bacterium]